jgi:anaerobic ribonucleoside-triphosphate reductase
MVERTMVERTHKDVGRHEHDVRIPCEVYSRVVGYLRPVQAWNHGKRQEFSERKTFEILEDSNPS